MKNIPDYISFKESVTEGSDYDKYATKMYGKKWDDLDKDKQTEVVDAIEGNFPLSKIKRVKESVDEAMAYKKAQKFTKKLNNDALLKDLIYVANKIHDKMGTNDDVQEWLKTVITYGNEHPQQWSESLDEAMKTIIVPANDVDDMNAEADYFQSFLKKGGVTAEVEAGVGELEIKVPSNAYKKAVKTIEAAGYQIGWNESLDEAAPKMAVDPDAEYVSDVISRLGVIGRSATGSNVQKDITKALKALQNLRSSIQVGR